jgi:hypothetical protein
MFDYSQLDNIFYFSAVVYLPAVFLFKKFIDSLSKETKVHLTTIFTYPWAVWCLSLSIFSTFGTYYTAKHLLSNNPVIFGTDSEFWYHAFIVSKLPELIDTFFIVIRSKPLVMLQYYHHWATLVMTFYLSNFLCTEATFYMFMNYCVHMFMYFYFAMYCFFPNIMKKFGTFVNILQTLQMFIAVFLAIYQYFTQLDNLLCIRYPNQKEILIGFYCGIVMYISYAVLFVMLFLERNERIKMKKV